MNHIEKVQLILHILFPTVHAEIPEIVTSVNKEMNYATGLGK